jgi:uncharacterized repeat protein (TIGR03803 family)
MRAAFESRVPCYVVALALSGTFAACSGSRLTPAGAMPSTISNVAQRTNVGFGYQVLYRFEGGFYGNEPQAGLTAVKGNLYGSTFDGGVGCGRQGCGVLFSIAPSGAFRVLHRFGGGIASPQGGSVATLLFSQGKLYGTPTGIGDGEFGTVYSSSLSGDYRMLHRFSGGKNGGNPERPLIALGNELYGTSSPYNAPGTIYKISPSGQEQVIWSFKGGVDGSDPTGLVAVNRELYGATYSGGKIGWGNIFKISTAGKKQIIHEFKPPYDGQGAMGSMILYNGKLYGTTVGGGAHDVGTVYEIDPVSNRESIVYSFAGSLANPDGANPAGSLIVVSSNFYGTTQMGGVTGSGTIFELSPGSSERVLHSFAGSGDGWQPVAGLTELGGKLYGTTPYGGRCCGTIFRINPQ